MNHNGTIFIIIINVPLAINAWKNRNECQKGHNGFNLNDLMCWLLHQKTLTLSIYVGIHESAQQILQLRWTPPWCFSNPPTFTTWKNIFNLTQQYTINNINTEAFLKYEMVPDSQPAWGAVSVLPELLPPHGGPKRLKRKLEKQREQTSHSHLPLSSAVAFGKNKC